MLGKLKEDTPADGVSILDNDDDEIAQKMTAHYSGLRDSWVPKVSNSQTGVRVSQFHRNLKTSAGQLIAELQTLSLSDMRTWNYVPHLQEIAMEQHFDVTWVDIEEKTTENRYHCLVQLSTLPVAVCFGVGDDASLAKSDAARNALDYLKVMVQKYE